MAVNALNSGAKVWLADFEDATSTLARNIVSVRKYRPALHRFASRKSVAASRYTANMADDELISELQNLRTAGGLSLAKLEASPTLLKALGAQSAEEGKDRLEQLLDKLSDDDKRVLSNAFNLSQEGSDTQFQRRAGYAAEFDTVDSVVEGWEDTAIRNLASLMAQGSGSSG
jgi:hypothetical protein